MSASPSTTRGPDRTRLRDPAPFKRIAGAPTKLLLTHRGNGRHRDHGCSSDTGVGVQRRTGHLRHLRGGLVPRRRQHETRLRGRHSPQGTLITPSTCSRPLLRFPALLRPGWGPELRRCLRAASHASESGPRCQGWGWRSMTTLLRTCRAAWSSTAARMSSTGRSLRGIHAGGLPRQGARCSQGRPARRWRRWHRERRRAGPRWCRSGRPGLPLACDVHRVRAVQVQGCGDGAAPRSRTLSSRPSPYATGSAPRLRKYSADDGEPVPMTRAPAIRASWTANMPTPPPAPPTSTVSSGPTSRTLRAADEVRPAIASVAAVRSSTPSGV